MGPEGPMLRPPRPSHCRLAALPFLVLLAPWAEVHGDDQKKFPNLEAVPDVNVVGPKAVIEWSKGRVARAEADFTAQGFRREPSPESWDHQAVYYVMVDRFANGDLKNDATNMPSFQPGELFAGAPYTVGLWRHGGDLEGVRSRLGYLQHLGVTVLWLSPIMLANTGYCCGYQLSDPSRIDPGFGSELLFRQLVYEAHQRGIKVVLDVVVNMASSEHLAYKAHPTIDMVTRCVQSAEDSYWNQSRTEYTNLNPAGDLEFGTNLPEWLANETFFQRCGPQDQFRPDNLRIEEGWDWKDIKTRQREAGIVWPEVFHSPADEPDFATTNPDFQAIFTNMILYWIAFADIDGLRLDATKYTSADYIAYISTHTRHYAASLGKTNFFLTGEVLSPGELPFLYLYVGKGPPRPDNGPACAVHAGCAGLQGDCCPSPSAGMMACCFIARTEARPIPRKVQDTWKELANMTKKLKSPGPGVPTFYPTDESDFMRDLVQGNANASSWWENQTWLEGMQKSRVLLGDQGLLQWSWQVIETHDIPRILSEKPGQAMDAWRLISAFVWSFTWFGPPAVYYGSEQGFNGRCYKYSEDGTVLEDLLDKNIVKDARETVLQMCEAGKDDSLKRQDMFTGAPWLLGSAIPSVQQTARISSKLAHAYPPHWCQEPVLDTENEVFRTVQALTRIRRACPFLGVPDALRAHAEPESQLAYWKVAKEVPGGAGPPAALVVSAFTNPPPSNSSFYAPDELGLTSGSRFVDLLNPQRTAEVVSRTGGTYLAVAAGAAPAHAAIFVSVDIAVPDGDAAWQVCKGADLPPLQGHEECESTPLWMTVVLMIACAAVLVAVFVVNLRRRGVYLCVVKEPSPVEVLRSPKTHGKDVPAPQHVFVAAIEHTIPERKVKVSAGGLGKVLDQMLREHPPARLSLVHPKFKGVDYGELTRLVTLEVTVDMKKHPVTVHTCESEDNGITRVWYLLEHPWFETQISKDAPYPYPMTKLSVLRFFSLWNQAAAQLMVMLKPDLYHCMDYHAAMVPLYVPPAEQVAMIIVLHNADYDGAIETDFVSDVFWQGVPALRRLSLIFNLDTEAIRKYLTFEGRFNMLWGGIACVEENQHGHGICTVSGKYAAELKRERTMFKGLPAVLPLDNAIDSAADDGPKSIAELKSQRAKSKQALQQFCELAVDPRAKILIFVGRWVKQKGVDHIALLASSILDRNPDVQFVLAGPPGDPYGSYAQELLRPLADQYKGRLFVVTRFFMLPKECRAGAHLCLMPSCSEPFGYVDVEFGLLGVPSLGCAIGGLGKMPGVYFRQQNSDSQEMLLSGFAAAVQYALNMKEDAYWEMSMACIPAQFPFSTWRENLQVIYQTALLNFDRALREDALTLDDETGFNVLLEHPAHREGFGYGRMIKGRDRRKYAEKGAKVQMQLQRMQVAESTEFLTQTVSEERVKELMSYWMATEGRETDAETLQSYISLGDHRMNEKNFATRGLMRPCRGFQQLLGGSCLRIHSVIALGYIISPIMDARLKFLNSNAKSLVGDYYVEILSGSASNLGAVLGCFLWLGLSRQVPANLLMAVTLFLNQLLFSLTSSFFTQGKVILVLFELICGVLTSARWLFLIWNFNEDFHGGFQVGTQRVAVLESLRAALAGVLSVQYPTAPSGIASILFSTLVLSLIILIMLAPSCYSSYVLPATNFWREIASHKVYTLLIASQSLNGLVSAAWNNDQTWLSMNGWTPGEISVIKLVNAASLIICLFIMFFTLHKISVWGPWAMRDFTCWLPPGSLLASFAFWELGHLHYRSYVFVVALNVAWIMDCARHAAMWTSILTTLANKWYALTGAFVGFGVIKVCEALSPVVAHFLAAPWGLSPVLSVLVPDHPETNVVTLQHATMLAVWPVALLAYGAQLLAWRYFVIEVLTYKGHGNLMPDGSKGWPASEMAFVKASSIRLHQGGASAASVLQDETDTEFSDGDTDAGTDREGV